MQYDGLVSAEGAVAREQCELLSSHIIPEAANNLRRHKLRLEKNKRGNAKKLTARSVSGKS